MPKTSLGSKVKQETRDMTAASGDVSYTGYGFKPTALVIFGVTAAGGGIGAWGIYGGEVDLSIYTQGDDTNFHGSSVLIEFRETATKVQDAVVKSEDVDGFTLTWTKAGVPAADTAILKVLALR